MRSILKRLASRHTTAVAYLALFAALGGSAYAAVTVTGRNVPKDALTGADIKNLTGKDVRNESLTGKDVKDLSSADVTNGGLLAEDFAPGQLPKGEPGPPGSIQGAPAGGDLTGSFPDPTIAAGAVNSAKVGDDSLTGADIVEGTLGQVPNAASADTATNAGLLDGKDSSAFLSNVVAATTGNSDPPNVPANSCFTADIGVTGIKPGDHLIVTTPETLSPALSVTPLIPVANGEARIRLCNHTNADVNEPVRTFNVIAIRP